MTSLLLHTAVLSCCILSWSHPNLEKLRFTSTFYNVTIPENSISRTLVMSSGRMGISRKAHQDDVTFKITSGDPDRIFKVEDRPVGDFIFLVLHTRGSSVVLNRERKDKFVLTIKAFSTKISIEATTIVYVRVVDQNDLSPIFFPPSYNATLPEDFRLYRPILRVSAEDADLGVNGEIIYSMKESSDHFAVHPFTGVLMLTNPLKYSERSVYDLTIVAQDRATVFRGGGQSSFAKVTVRVRQVNFFGPEIYVYVLHEPSLHRLGWTYAVARVLDRDEGVHGEIEDVRIVKGDSSSLFTVVPVDESNNRTEYNIVLLNSFKEESIFSLVNLSLQVSDRGFPQRKSYKGISFRLKRVVDNDPRFIKEFYEINVPEYLPQGSPLIRLSILNIEQFILNKFSVMIKEGNINESFRVYSRKSVLCTNKPLDSEKLGVFTLSLCIVDKDGKSVKGRSSAKVKVNIIDFNDNIPVFNEIPEEVWVNENQPPGSHVIKVTATDRDSGDNGQVTYSIANINRTPFEMDPLTGVLRTTQPLDYEYATHIYFMNVRASDSGYPFRLETQKTITIQVRNINDNSPEFTKGECSLSIPKNIRVGSDLFSITATDLDETDVITYSIFSSYRDDCIKIDASKGMLSLQCDLNEVSKSEWDVNITANDGIHKAHSHLRIFVVSLQIDSDELNMVQYSCRDVDVLKDDPRIGQFSSLPLLSVDNAEYETSAGNKRENIHYPLFINLPESLNVKETLSVNEIVYKLEAVDTDEGINGKIVYGLASKPEEVILNIDTDTGVIYLFSEINYEDQKQYILNVSICDLGMPRKCSFGNIKLNILDSNNRSPKFKESQYEFHIPENIKVGAEILNVKATDNDFSMNQDIGYYLTSNDAYFSIDQSGSITLKTPLDRETADVHTITVKAADGQLNSNDTLYSEATVTFYIEDVNDNAPTFINPHLVANVPEDLPIGSIVFIVDAMDRDEGESGDLCYSVDNEFFKIDSLTGAIRLESKLDFETKNEHRVIVTVTDKGMPALSTSETVIIKVTDVDENLHSPTFDEVVLVGSVREGLPVGTSVASVAASDADATGADSKVIYQLQGGNGVGLFTTTEQGQILTASVLDAEYADHYWLTVVATDRGLLPLSATIQVYISVQDYNDRLPLTLEPFYSLSVEENLPSLTVVGQVTAADDDVSSTNLPTGDNRRSTNLLYSLSPSSSFSPFTIDSNTGLISTTRLLDREDVAEYVIEVVVTDRGTPSLSSVTAVRVTVLDVNDHSPQFTQDHYVIKPHHIPQIYPPSSVLEAMKSVTHEHDGWRKFTVPPKLEILPLFQVLSVDKDEGNNGNVTYGISTDSPFTVCSSTGAVYPLMGLKPGTKHEFQIKAGDNGNPSRSSIGKVTVYIPENAWTLGKVREVKRITAEVPESLSSGDVVMQIDHQTTDNSETTFLITGGDGAEHFAVVGDQLLSIGRLSRSTMRTMLLNMAALNTTHIRNIQIEIHILAVNGHYPKFLSSHYSLNVTEDTPEGSVLTTLQAEDADVNSTLLFSVVNCHPGSGMFRMDHHTGDLVLAAPLDRELAASHLLTVRVSDDEQDPRQGYARVHITVEDVNDHAPLFTADSVTLRVSEEAAFGTVLATLVAGDGDDGDNGVVEYAIVSGNANDTFKLNKETGDILVNNVLDTSKTTNFQLIVKAMDKGDPPLESRVHVYIDVITSEKKIPLCKTPSLTEVSENTRTGEEIGSINVNSLPFLTYEIVSGDPGGMFSVNPTTGDVLLTKSLDYETTSEHNISVRVTSRAGLPTECFITVYVTDYNDHAPTLKQESLIGSVDESVPIGTFIMTNDGPLRILVDDSDSGDNAMFEFILKGKKGKDLLAIDPITGTVRTAGPLDYETLKEIKVSISVNDLGSPPLTAPTVASLKVFVRDVNDCPPRFLQRGYNATVILPTERDVFIIQVAAEDADTKDVTRLEYSITSGNDDVALSIDQVTGEIFVQDPQKLHSREITVRVFDGIFQDVAPVNIAGLQHQPSGLRFQRDIYLTAVMENTTKTSIVAVVNLLGSFLDENIRFSILNRKRNPSFSIGPTSGIISTTGDVFDREEQDIYNLIVQAHSLDRQLAAFTTVNVSVLDVNDNCPQFSNLPYRAAVAGNATKGDFVFKVSADDFDVGENGEVRFELDQGGSEIFRIGRKSGEIRVKNLGLQTKQVITVRINAYDGGIIPCYTSTTLAVSVVDASAPQWRRAVYKASVSEDAQLFSSVPVALKATAVHKVIYQLINSSDFLLRHDTGELQVYAPLDREALPLHRLQVRATDSVTGSSSDTLVLLEVTDVNDHPPAFLEDEYRARVLEEAAVGTMVAEVAATDVDEGNNGTVRYSLIDSYFKVEPTNGKLVLRRHLDYEDEKRHSLQVVATDSGVPARSAHVYVFIEVINSNDNPPEFGLLTSKFVVSQDANRGFLVGKVTAFDKDKDTIYYKATSKDSSALRTFAINDKTGIITVANPKELRVKQQFVINITVEDGLYSTNGFVEIHVLPSNRHPPKFNRDVYETEVEENKPAGTKMIRVAAFDKDTGVFGNISYTLPPQRSTKYFTLDEYSGDITTRLPLDREDKSFHILDVMARDGGGLISWAKVKVKVTDINDNKPLFDLSQYYGCVGNESTTDRDILKITATDSDEGPSGVVRYSIVSSEPSEAKNWFWIDPIDGSVTLTNLEVMSGPPRVRLTIRASDMGSPPLYSDVTVSLSVSRDLLPSPLRSFPSRLRIPSTADRGFVIHRFEQKRPQKVNFSIIGNGDYLAINSTGHLYIKSQPIWNHNIIGLLAQSQDTKSTICAFYKITVEKYPLIHRNVALVQDKLKLTLPENLAVGTLVYKVATTQEDPTVLFSLTTSSKVFSVDPVTGWISLLSPLDREAHGMYDVTVVASSRTGSQSSCDVTLVITDVNDNPHIFNQDIYNVAVKEDAPLGTEVARLSLVDPDQTHDVIQYVIIGGDEGAVFRTSADRVVLARPLDREEQTAYSLVVVVSDGTFTASTVVNVVVIDVNDEPHRCVHSLYNVTVVESQPPGHLVTSILTSDPDLETSLSYHLLGQGHEKFYVDNHGDLRLKQYLDREMTDAYTLAVTVTDPTHPEWSCVSRVAVIVDDVNDNSPSFAVNNETIMVTEDTVVGTIVTKITVLDYDKGPNRSIRYFLVNPSGLFNLSSDSGLLSLARSLPNGPGSVYYVTVRATDQGKPPLSSVSTLQVVVLGMNDDPPVYLSGLYHVTVAEDAPVASSLLQLQSFSDELSRRSTVVYTILEGNGLSEFDIDRTGLLSISKPLDYESRQNYQLLILATSVGDSSITSYSSVNVSVIDVNDNAPLFKVNRFSVQIREDIEVGQIVLKIEAIDIDSGSNGIIRYSLDADSMQQFAIDSFNGILMVISALDREKKAQYNISAVATDQGYPPLSSTAHVNIEVLDVNDNPPIFLTSNVTTVLQADRMPGWAVFHFGVADADLTFNTSFTFHLIEGNKKEMFRVDSDGTLRTTDKLNIRLGDQHTLVVRVEDSNDPTLYSSTWIYIKVVEPSKHPPVVHPLRVWLGVYEHQWSGGDLGVITSSDLDPYDKLEFSVPTNPQFTVDPRHGTLKARGSLAPGMYSVNVSATDGKFTATATVDVTVDVLRQDMLQTSVYIRLSPRITSHILATKLPQFLSTLQSAFLRDVKLISVQDNPNSTVGLLIAVDGGADLNVVKEVMLTCGLSGTTPQCDCRNGGVCQRQLQMMPEKTTVLSGPGISFVTPGHSLTYYCICSMGYAGDHCEEIKCLCPPLQVCVPQKVGFTCIPPCSANQTCPAAMTSAVTWSELVTCLLASMAVITTVAVFVVYRRYRSSSSDDQKYGSWGKQNCQTKKKSKLSNLMTSQKPAIFTGSPNNGTIGRNNLEGLPTTIIEGDVIPLDYLRNINPLSKMENDILQGHSSAPDLATCHITDVIVLEDPARGLAALDDQLSQEVVQYGFPPPASLTSLPEELEVSL